MFAKLFGDDQNQVLAFLAQDEENDDRETLIELRCRGPKGSGVAFVEVSLRYATEEAASKAFDKLTKEKVDETLRPSLRMLARHAAR